MRCFWLILYFKCKLLFLVGKEQSENELDQVVLAVGVLPMEFDRLSREVRVHEFARNAVDTSM
jgi:hypothetical protein